MDKSITFPMPSTTRYQLTDEQFNSMNDEAERYALAIDELMSYETYPELMGDEYADAVLSTIA